LDKLTYAGTKANLEPVLEKIDFIVGDILDPLLVDELMSQADLVVHFAAETHNDRSLLSPYIFFETNILGTHNLVRSALDHDVHFHHVSTDEVFGTALKCGSIMPSNPYAASKAAQEMIAIAYARTYKLPIVITNCNNVIGKYQNKEKFIPKVIDLVSQLETVQIHTKNGVAGKRYYNNIHNVTTAIDFILSHYKSSEEVQRYGLPGGELWNNFEIAKEIARLLNRILLFKFVDAEKIRPGYDEYYPMADNKLIKMGFKPIYTVKQALAEVINA
jgi:dTDP-glucose 4,6-dehydratase